MFLFTYRHGTVDIIYLIPVVAADPERSVIQSRELKYARTALFPLYLCIFQCTEAFLNLLSRSDRKSMLVSLLIQIHASSVDKRYFLLTAAVMIVGKTHVC